MQSHVDHVKEISQNMTYQAHTPVFLEQNVVDILLLQVRKVNRTKLTL